MPQLPRPVEPFARVRRHATDTVQRRSTEPFRQNARPRRTSEDTSCRTPPGPGNPFSHWIFNATSSHFLQQTAERLAHAWHSRRASGPPSPGGTFPARRQITPNRLEKSTKKIFQTLYFSKGSNLSGNCWRLRCAIFFAGPTPGRHPANRSGRPPAGSQGPRGRSIFRTKGEYRCGAAPQTRGEPGRGRRQPVSGGRRSDDRRDPSRSPTGPTSDRPDVPSAGSRAPPPSRGRAAGDRMPAVLLRRRCRPGCGSGAERRSPLPGGAAPGSA